MAFKALKKLKFARESAVLRGAPKSHRFRIQEEEEQAKDPKKKQSEDIKTTTVFLPPRFRGESVLRRKIWITISNAAERSGPLKADNSHRIKRAVSAKRSRKPGGKKARPQAWGCAYAERLNLKVWL